MKNNTLLTDEEFINCINARMTIDEIKSKYGYSKRSSIIKRAKNLKVFDILNGYDPIRIHTKIDLQTLKEKINLGWTNTQLAEFFKCNEDAICLWRKKYKLLVNRKQRILDIEFTNSEFQVLYGTILGDGCLNKNKNHQGTFSHCINQKQYAEYKQNYLSRFSNPIIIKTIKDTRPNWPDSYDMCYCYIKCSTALNNLYSKVYNANGIKYIDYDTIMKLDGLGLAIWYMDDGNNPKYGGYSIATMSFNDNDLKTIKKYFLDKWQIEVIIRKDKTIYVPSKFRSKFNEIVYPYMDKSMLYKLKSL